MGTRGITGFVVDGEEKIAYQQFDSYPSGVGIEVLTWLRLATDSVTAMRQQARKLKVIGTRGDAPDPTPQDIAALAKYTDLGVSEQSTSDWYCLTRKTQGRLDLILESGYLLSAGDFPIDSLFCEWGYVVDLDTETLEVYRGFQKTVPTTGRWAGRPTPAEDAEDYKEHLRWCKETGRDPWRPKVSEFKAVTLAASWPLSALPTDEEFLALEGSGEDDD